MTMTAEERQAQLGGAPRRRPPRQGRAHQTYERLLDVAGDLLGEVGVERISTNLICARAGMTPPALYRYFGDKYAVLAALGLRLLERRNAALSAWLERHAPQGAEGLADGLESLIHETARVTASEPGGLWILRALRAVPQLNPIRLEALRQAADRMTEVYAPLHPDLPRAVVWRRVRLAAEFCHTTDEMLSEDTAIGREDLMRDAALILRHALRP